MSSVRTRNVSTITPTAIAIANVRNGAIGTRASIANDPGKLGTGVVTMVVNGTLRVFAIAGDAVNSVRTTKYDGKSWGPWQTIVGTPATRGFLAANGCGDGAHAAIVWTEGTSAPYRIVGLDVSSTF